jgi:hypothetical protein
MKKRAIREAVRDVRPPEPPEWHTTEDGRRILARVLRRARDEESETVTSETRRRSAPRKLIAIGAAVATAAVALLVGPQLIDSDERTDSASVSQPRAGFFDPLRFGSGMREVEHYDSLNAASSAASAVVLAEVVDVRATRVIVGEGKDRIHMAGVVLRPTEVLNGRLNSTSDARITVEFMMGSENPSRSVELMKSQLPSGTSLWFLRSKAEEGARHLADLRKAGRTPSADARRAMAAEKDFYRVVSSQGLFVQSGQDVTNPIVNTDEGADPMVKEGERYTQVSQLARDVRGKG